MLKKAQFKICVQFLLLLINLKQQFGSIYGFQIENNHLGKRLQFFAKFLE